MYALWVRDPHREGHDPEVQDDGGLPREAHPAVEAGVVMDALIVAAVVFVVFLVGAVLVGIGAAVVSGSSNEAGDLDGGPGS